MDNGRWQTSDNDWCTPLAFGHGKLSQFVLVWFKHLFLFCSIAGNCWTVELLIGTWLDIDINLTLVTKPMKYKGEYNIADYWQCLSIHIHVECDWYYCAGPASLYHPWCHVYKIQIHCTCMYMIRDTYSRGFSRREPCRLNQNVCNCWNSQCTEERLTTCNSVQNAAINSTPIQLTSQVNCKTWNLRCLCWEIDLLSHNSYNHTPVRLRFRWWWR